QLRKPQYMTCGATIWAPGDSDITTAADADMPEPNKAAACAPSSAAMTSSVWRAVGLSARPYAKPERYWLSASRKEVVARGIGGTMAPITGSVTPSAWAARVRGFQRVEGLSIKVSSMPWIVLGGQAVAATRADCP